MTPPQGCESSRSALTIYDVVFPASVRLLRVKFTWKRATASIALMAIGWWTIGTMGEHRAKAERDWCRSLSRRSQGPCVVVKQGRGSFPPGHSRPGIAPGPTGQLGTSDPIVYRLFGVDPLSLQERSLLGFAGEPAAADRNRRYRRPRTDRVLHGAARVSRGLSCPANHFKVRSGVPGPIHYVGIGGLGIDAPTLPGGHPRAGVFGYDHQTRMVDIKDGASTTMLLAETTFANGPWTAGGPATVRGLDPERQPYVGPDRQFGGSHRGGAMVAFADGSVRFLRGTIAPGVFEGLSTVAGGEILAEGWDRSGVSE